MLLHIGDFLAYISNKKFAILSQCQQFLLLLGGVDVGSGIP